MYSICFYLDRRGQSPIDAFLDSLRNKDRSKVQGVISHLEREGPDLRRPYADHVRGKIRELRIPYGRNQYRILYFFHDRGQIVLLHAFAKKGWKLPEQGIRMAEWRMRDWVSRQP